MEKSGNIPEKDGEKEMEDQEKRKRRRQSRERQRREAERRKAERKKQERIERERIRRKKQVHRQMGILTAAAVLLILLIWGGVTIRAERREAAAQAAAAAAKEQEEREQQQAEQQAEEAMGTAMEELQEDLEAAVLDYDGSWSVYVKELEYDNSFSINNRGIYPASLIKLFAMAATYENMEQVLDNETDYLGSSSSAKETIQTLLENMIEISDNEAYNELVRLQSSSRDFTEGCSIINEYLQENGYVDTGVHTTLHPAASSSVKDGLGDNVTSVEDCGKLLEKIYRGTCGSQEDSGEMLHLLLNQENTLKIPGGLPDGIEVAHKTGETTEVQHDAGIIYGENTDFILCIMVDDVTSAAYVYPQIHELTETVYDALN